MNSEVVFQEWTKEVESGVGAHGGFAIFRLKPDKLGTVLADGLAVTNNRAA